MEEIEKLLGRELEYLEKVLYEKYKDTSNYTFYKDKQGNLIVTNHTDETKH